MADPFANYFLTGTIAFDPQLLSSYNKGTAAAPAPPKTTASTELGELLKRANARSAATRLYMTLHEKAKWQGESAPVPAKTNTFEMKKIRSKPG